ncbi:thionin-like protein 2 [Durio zibethinus]|uniref:Thionin-like protein 2 n=1 Tax=Durio zibethinus TaxID=66656 RepID=A0A6P5X5X3_DURZI|nr:thionin-like protein 2 [Durio zibethinus]
MVCLVFGILVGQSTAQFVPTEVCYATCYILCILRPETTAGSCAIECLKNCILFKSTVGTIKDTQSFCKLGSATALCSNLSTKENPAKTKVVTCVDACAATCAKNN